MKCARLIQMVLLVALLNPRMVKAAEPVESKTEKAALTAQAGVLYDQGAAAYKEQKWAQARAAFLAAWALEKHWQIAANLADTEIQLGRFRDAAEHAAFYRKQSPEDRHARADALLVKAKAKVLTLRIKTEPAGADVWVDGQSAGRAPLSEPLFLDPGKHTITARMTGHADMTQSIDKPAGSDDTLRLKLQAATTTTPAPKPKSLAILLSGGAGTLAFAAVGAGLSGAAADKAGQADKLLQSVVSRGGSNACSQPSASLKTDCEMLHSFNKGSDTLQNTGTAMFVVGGLAAAGTLAYWLWPSDNPKATVAVAPSPTGIGVAIRGEF